ncbi:MAG TPA: TlpA disulfide reductase family protein [Kofleriaceae bacterium]|nr:TlpA disulfide reductase family protein [Kofleriaceae bacterium]
MNSTSALCRAITIGALAAAACHTSDPPRKPAAATAEPPNEGEVRAARVGARRIGTPAPALTLKTIDGETIDLARLYGDKPVYLKFWATWCIPCRAQMPGFERTFEALGDRVHVIAVNTGLDDDEAAVRKLRAQFGLRMPVVMDDGTLAAALDLTVTPQHIVIGRDGKIAYVGHVDGAPLDQALQKALAAAAPATPAAAQPVAVRPAFRIGDAVTGLDATTIDGARVRIGGSGRPTAVVLFSAWCETYDGIKNNQPRTLEDCRRVRAQLATLTGQGDVDWIGVARGLWSDPADVAEYKATAKISYPLVFDGDGAIFRAFGVRQAPTVALIARDGRLVRLVGPDDRDLADAVRKLAEAR